MTGDHVLVLFYLAVRRSRMADGEKLTRADPHEIADSVAFALRFSGRKRVHDSDRFMASIVAERIVMYLDRCGFVVLKKTPIGGSAPFNPPANWPHTKV